MPRFLILALALTGCATSSLTYGPNGEPLLFVECDHATMTTCYNEAAKRCPGGYRIVEKTQETQPGVLSTSTTQNLTVACH